jgi:hypothetical protein
MAEPRDHLIESVDRFVTSVQPPADVAGNRGS